MTWTDVILRAVILIFAVLGIVATLYEIWNTYDQRHNTSAEEEAGEESSLRKAG